MGAGNKEDAAPPPAAATPAGFPCMGAMPGMMPGMSGMPGMMPGMPGMCGAMGAGAMGAGAMGVAAMGVGAGAMAGLPGMANLAGMANLPGMAAMGMAGGTAAPMNNKKQRELYVGNLPSGISEPMLKELFSQILQACEGFNAALGPAVLNVQLCGGGTYAFVEFRDETMCETARQFTGMVLSSKNLRLNHPNGYVPPPVPVKVLTPPPSLLQKFGLGSAGALDTGGAVQQLATARIDNKKARELYVGNLTVGAVTAAMLKELFNAPLLTLPGGESADGFPPVIDARVDAGGKFAFVEFREEHLATTALSLFNTMELCGRPMQVARPSGYAPPAGSAAPPGQLPVPLGATPPVPPPPPPPPQPPPTRHLRLENLLTEAVMNDEAELRECLEDIRNECERFGPVASFVVPRQDELHGHPQDDVGKCFVRYESVASAASAQRELHGRDFDGNTVKATFLPEE